MITSNPDAYEYRMNPPVFNIDLDAFTRDPYPTLASMRNEASICHVPQLNATLLTLRDDIFKCEKMVEVFSSDQPGGLMTVLMGQNMMRKDGDEHLLERRQLQTAVSSGVVKAYWKQQFERDTAAVLCKLEEKQTFDLVSDFAMPVSAHALRHITGLVNMTPDELDNCSQGMIDGVANYMGDQSVEQRCYSATALIDQRIDDMLANKTSLTAESMISVLLEAGQSLDSIRANIKLAISGGQNEPRDAIAGTVWALLTDQSQLDRVLNQEASWLQAFEEYARWMSPIGMSPRRIAKSYQWKGIDFKRETCAFLMFGSGNRDESIFDEPARYNVMRNTSKAISFGAGPHFCAGAAASRVLIGEVALPMLFEKYPDLMIDGVVNFSGWAFRGPLSMPVRVNHR